MNDFFARSLTLDARPIDNDENTVLVSPTDGTVLTFGVIENDN